MQPTGLNSGLDPQAIGTWFGTDLMGIGTGEYVIQLKPDGTVECATAPLAGQFSTNHNGLAIPSSAMFMSLTQATKDAQGNLTGITELAGARFNFGNEGTQFIASTGTPGAASASFPTIITYDAKGNQLSNAPAYGLFIKLKKQPNPF